METQMEYKARIIGLMEGKDPVAVQRETGLHLAQLIDGVPTETLRARPAPDKWSVAEVLAHLSEGEITSSWRYRQMIEHDGCSLPGYDQELWARLGGYAIRKPETSLQLFRLLREENLQMFDKLTPEEWQRHGVHTERGEMTVRDLAVQIAGHDMNHVAQIRKILNP
ncbi:MAG: DinB family protein [Candidatus Korobacteraceae bacterium]